jgi:hypothetical protein
MVSGLPYVLPFSEDHFQFIFHVKNKLKIIFQSHLFRPSSDLIYPVRPYLLEIYSGGSSHFADVARTRGVGAVSAVSVGW